jgi:hypothetical protein
MHPSIGLFLFFGILVDGLLQQRNVRFQTKTLLWNSRQGDWPDNSLVSRRNALISSIASVWFLSVGPAFAEASLQEETVLLKGAVTLASDVELATSDKAALYITCRPDKADNVPSAILSGTRGKPPPVLAARFENPTFPFQFRLSSPRDLTIEGASDGTSSSTTPVLDPSKFWWKDDALIVSARWDSDGVAATRSPEDLVGRGVWTGGDAASAVEVPLTGRGAFGKFATGGSKK